MQERVVALIDNCSAEKVGLWVLADRDSDALLGTACLWNWDRDAAVADLGYLLDPARWGEGLMHEALVPVLEFGRTRMGLRRIEARVDPDNLASIRVLTRLEFTAVGRDEHETVFALDTPTG
jgi:ribosomal-protein-alanine N-acetyltransferase